MLRYQRFFRVYVYVCVLMCVCVNNTFFVYASVCSSSSLGITQAYVSFLYFLVEDIISLIDNVAMQLTNGFRDRTLQLNVISMCSHLKLYANQLEAIYKGMFLCCVFSNYDNCTNTP